MQRVILSIFCPVLIAIIIRVVLFALSVVWSILNNIFSARKEIKEIAENIGFFDTFIWSDSWLYWGLVVIMVFIAEMIIWGQSDNQKEYAYNPDMAKLVKAMDHNSNSREIIQDTTISIEKERKVEDNPTINSNEISDGKEEEKTNSTNVTTQKNVEVPTKESNSENVCSSENATSETKTDTDYKVIDGILFIPEGTSFIKSNIIKNNDYVSEVMIPLSVTKICNNAFSNTLFLKSLIIPNSVVSIGEEAFANSSLSSIIIPDSIVSIGAHAFKSCHLLSSITIPNSVLSIGEGVFSGSSLKSISIPVSIKTIPDSSFYGCIYLKSVHLHNTVTSIGDSAFGACSELVDIRIPDSVNYIGDMAFSECPLKIFDIPDSVTYIGSCVFCNSELETINIHKSIANFTADTFLYSACLERINVDPENTDFSSIDGVLFNKAGTTLICVPQNYKIKTYQVPITVCRIEDHAFQNCDNIEEVILPDSLIEIGSSAFCRCSSLQKVTLNDSNKLKEIGLFPFMYCSNLNKECKNRLVALLAKLDRDRSTIGFDLEESGMEDNMT